MSAPRAGSGRFVAAEPLRVVQDLDLGRPVLLIGHWLDHRGAVIAHEVLSLSQARPVLRIYDAPQGPPRQEPGRGA